MRRFPRADALQIGFSVDVNRNGIEHLASREDAFELLIQVVRHHGV